MFKILLTTHGELCEGMLKTAKIFTEDVSHIKAIPFYGEDDTYDPNAELEQFISELQAEDVVIVLTDILWGSVNQKIFLNLNNKENVHIITGLNLPLLLEMITLDAEQVSQAVISEKVKSCKESMVYMREYTIVDNDEDE